MKCTKQPLPQPITSHFKQSETVNMPSDEIDGNRCKVNDNDKDKYFTCAKWKCSLSVCGYTMCGNQNEHKEMMV